MGYDSKGGGRMACKVVTGMLGDREMRELGGDGDVMGQ